MWLGPETYVSGDLLAPGSWEFTLTVYGEKRHRTIDDFDCNVKWAIIHVRCEGDVHLGVGGSLLYCGGE